MLRSTSLTLGARPATLITLPMPLDVGLRVLNMSDVEWRCGSQMWLRLYTTSGS